MKKNSLKFAVWLPEVIHPKIPGGGHLNTVRFAELLGEYAEEVHLISYNEKEEGIWYLPEVLEKLEEEQYISIITWGPHINDLLDKYYGRFPFVYYQQSNDWEINLPADVPVISMSKYMMATAQQFWPSNPQFYLPQVMPTICKNNNVERDIDVLIVKRKLPSYITETLHDELKDKCNVYYLDHFVSRDELYALFNRSKVYLYAFDPQRTEHTSTGWRMMEGIATQVLEAISCGATVFSDLRGGQIDFVQPWENGYKLQTYSMEWDIHQILNAIEHYPQSGHAKHEAYIQSHYGEEVFHERVTQFISFISTFVEFSQTHKPDAAPFNVRKPLPLKTKIYEKLRGKAYCLKRNFFKKITKGRK